MGVARKKDELQEIRADDLAKKIKLEVPFARDVNTFLRRINTEFAQQYIADGTVIDASDFKPELISLLTINYNRISKAFKFNIRESFDDTTSKEINALINTRINRFTRNISNFKSDIILDTTNREIAKELSVSIEDLIEDEKPVSNLTIATTTRRSLNDKATGRATIISMAETQNMAESAKDIEEKTLVDGQVILGGIALARVLKDIWVTTLDERTRVSHVAANRQEKSSFESFLVGGEALSYPGDPNGSPGNIIGCRCSKVSAIF